MIPWLFPFIGIYSLLCNVKIPILSASGSVVINKSGFSFSRLACCNNFSNDFKSSGFGDFVFSNVSDGKDCSSFSLIFKLLF